MKYESLIKESESNSELQEQAAKISETSWIINLEEDPETGDLILPLPNELLATQNWQIGDTLVWDITDGVASLTKKNDA